MVWDPPVSEVKHYSGTEMIQSQVITRFHFTRAREKDGVAVRRTLLSLTVYASYPILPPPLLAFATIDDGAGITDQPFECSRLVEFPDPISGRNVNQNPMHKQNWE